MWLVHNGRRDEVIVAGLTSRVPGGSVRRLPQIRLRSPASESPMRVVTEGGLPSRLVIGDDNSRLASAVVVPGGFPSSMSAWLTHDRTDSTP